MTHNTLISSCFPGRCWVPWNSPLSCQVTSYRLLVQMDLVSFTESRSSYFSLTLLVSFFLCSLLLSSSSEHLCSLASLHHPQLPLLSHLSLPLCCDHWVPSLTPPDRGWWTDSLKTMYAPSSTPPLLPWPAHSGPGCSVSPRGRANASSKSPSHGDVCIHWNLHRMLFNQILQCFPNYS